MAEGRSAGRARRGMKFVLGGLLVVVVLGYGAVLVYFDRNEDRLVYPGAYFPGLDPWDGQSGVAWDSMRVEAEDGVPVFLLESRIHDDAPWVLALHGNGNFVGSFGPMDDYRLLQEAGFNVLAVEYRGYGASAGVTPSEEGLYADVRAAWDHLTGTRGVPSDRVVLFGSSLGAGPATWLAAQEDAAGMITKGAFTSLPAAARGPYPWLPAGLLMNNRFDNLSRAPSIEEPWLVFHNRDDQLIPLAHGEALAAAAPAAELVPLEGGHNTLLSSESGRVLPALQEFRARVVSRQ